MTATVKHIVITDWKQRMQQLERQQARKARAERIGLWIGRAVFVLFAVGAAAIVWGSMRSGQAAEVTLSDIVSGAISAWLMAIAITSLVRRPVKR